MIVARYLTALLLSLAIVADTCTLPAYWCGKLVEANVTFSDQILISFCSGEWCYASSPTGVGQGPFTDSCDGILHYCAGNSTYGFGTDQVSAFLAALDNGGRHPDAPEVLPPVLPTLTLEPGDSMQCSFRLNLTRRYSENFEMTVEGYEGDAFHIDGCSPTACGAGGCGSACIANEWGGGVNIVKNQRNEIVGYSSCCNDNNTIVQTVAQCSEADGQRGATGPADNSVRFSFQINGLNYAALTAHAALHADFRAAVIETIVSEAGSLINDSHVALDLSAGSVAAQAGVSHPSASTVLSVADALSSSQTFGASLSAQIGAVPGISAVTTGPISMSGFFMGNPTIGGANITTTATTTTFPPSYFMSSAYTAAIESQERSLVNNLLASGVQSLISYDVVGAVTKVARVNMTELQTSDVTVALDGTSAAVTIPPALLQETGVEPILVLLTAFELSEYEAQSQTTDSSEAVVEATLGHLSVKVSTLRQPGVPLEISNLADPMIIALNTSASAGMDCVYWDDEQGAWSSDGMAIVAGNETSPLVCSSNHLTIFAALLRGFLRAFVCSNARLFSNKGLKALRGSAWLYRSDMLIFWGFVILLLLMFATAAYLDHKWAKQGLRSDALFFINCDDGADLEEEVGAETADGNTCLQGAKDCCNDLKDIFEPLCKAFVDMIFAFGGIMNDIYDGLIECIQPRDDDDGKHLSRCARISRGVNRLIARVHVTTIRLEAGHALWMANEDLTYLAGRSKEARGDKSGSSNMSITRVETEVSGKVFDAGASSQSQVAIEVLQQEVTRQISTHNDLHSICWRVPLVFFRVFIAKCGWMTVLKYSMFTPAKLNVLLLMCEVFGDMAGAALFYQSSGSALAASSPPECNEEQSLWEKRGTMIAVGLVSAYVSMVPVVVIGIIHERDFAPTDMALSERRKLIRKWYHRDVVITVVGVSYCVICLLFTALFLANVTKRDGLIWMVSCVIGVAQGSLAIPMLISLGLVLCMMLTLCVDGAREATKDILAITAKQEAATGDDVIDVDVDAEDRPYLVVTIVSCTGLRNADWGPGRGMSDPYCICKVLTKLTSERSEFRTPVVVNNLSPTWNHSAAISDYNTGDCLMFRVMDKDWLMSDDLLGDATLNIAMITPDQEFDGELQLAHAGKDYHPSLHVRVRMVPAADVSEALRAIHDQRAKVPEEEEAAIHDECFAAEEVPSQELARGGGGGGFACFACCAPAPPKRAEGEAPKGFTDPGDERPPGTARRVAVL